jgi:hypothetical protein
MLSNLINFLKLLFDIFYCSSTSLLPTSQSVRRIEVPSGQINGWGKLQVTSYIVTSGRVPS